eukprot:s2370_g7.t1
MTDLLELFHSWRLTCGEVSMWNSAAELASAYKLGKTEAGAASNLLNEIEAPIVQRLTGMVKQWTIGRFLTHEAIQSGVFNQNYCGAAPSMAGWEEALTNSMPLLNLVLDRMESDFAGLNAKMRKPYSASAETLLRACGAFKACADEFAKKFPVDFVKSEEPAIMKGFMLKHADAELISMLEESSPPVDLTRVAIFRVAARKYEKQAGKKP